MNWWKLLRGSWRSWTGFVMAVTFLVEDLQKGCVAEGPLNTVKQHAGDGEIRFSATGKEAEDCQRWGN